MAGSTIWLTGATPAHAQVCYGTDPVFGSVCAVLNDLSQKPGEIVYRVYCTLWPHC